MVNLMVLDDGDAFTDSLCKALRTEFAVYEGESCATDGTKPGLRLWREPVSGADGASIVLCGPDCPGVPGNHLVPQGVGVVLSEQTTAVKMLSGWQLPVITCGMSATDTLTFSSYTADSAVLCLQRSIPGLNGELIEPGEIPLTLAHPCGRYTLLAAASVFLLTGRGEQLRGRTF